MLCSSLAKPPTSHLSFTHADHQTLQRRSTAIDLNQTIPLTSSKRARGSSLGVSFALIFFSVYTHGVLGVATVMEYIIPSAYDELIYITRN